MHAYINVELDDSIKKASGFSNRQYLIPLINHIDYNEIGNDGVTEINDDGLRDFIIKNIQSGVSIKKLSGILVNEHIRLIKYLNTSSETGEKLAIGGYLVTEMELHKNEKGVYETLFEINQLKLYFASHFNSASKANKVNVFAEFNPIPEEVIHQINSGIIKKGAISDTLTEAIVQGEEHNKVPFERLFIHIKNVANTKLGITFGQFRNPFGFWSDYSSHRNFNATKNNILVNGFALKKIETGIKLDYRISDSWQLEAALVYGRFGRTAPLYKEDFDRKKDVVAHITHTSKKALSIVASGYFSEGRTNVKNAYGIDFSYQATKLILSGEVVHQRNNKVSSVSPKVGSFIDQISSTGGYFQLDYEVHNKLHVYGMYEYWQLLAEGKKSNKTAFCCFSGHAFFCQFTNQMDNL